MGKVYVITSGKGGVGKTTSAVNIGSCINYLGKEAIIVDANLTTPNIGIHLGNPIAPINLNHVINNQAKVEEAIYEHETGVKILPASLSISDLKKANHNRLPDIAKRLRKISSNIIMDSSAGLGDEAKAAIKSADEVIIIANPEICSITDALKAIKLSDQMKKEILGCVITRYTGRKVDMDIPSVKEMLDIPILGIVPEDNAIKESQRMQKAVVYSHPKSKSAQAYQKIAKRILGPEYYKEQAEKIAAGKESIFKRFLKKMGF